jgi:large subunit ribosomal protein L13
VKLEKISVEKTYIPKAAEIQEQWYVVDATGQTLGRLASEIATVLLGKHKPDFTPGMDTGAHVIVVNCGKVAVTGKKMDDKIYYHHSQYPSGIKSISLRQQLNKHPDRVLKSAVWGMLPHNKYGRQVIKKLKLYSGPEHPHAAQNPVTLAEAKE